MKMESRVYLLLYTNISFKFQREKTKITINSNNIKIDQKHVELNTLIDDRIFSSYNAGKFETFLRYADMKKLYLYFNWIKNANYLPADGIVQLSTNFLKFNK